MRVAISQRHTRTPTTFPRSHRITRGPELREIARRGKRLRTEHLDVRVSASLLHLAHPRVGFVVPKHGKSAVERNRLKRRLRELTRTALLPRMAPMDMVIHARPSAYRLRFDELARIAATIEHEAARAALKLAAVD